MIQPLHLHKLEISNFMRLVAASIDADGKHVIIKGPNGAGKTSAVEAIFAALAGTDSKEIPEPIHRGADSASVTLDLGEFIVEKHYSASGSRLTIKNADGSKVKGPPQKILDGLLGKYSLDPVAFLERRPQDQLDDVLAICSIAPPVDKVRDLTGEDHAPKPNESADRYLERLSADEFGLFYVRRREMNRQVDIARGAVIEQEDLVKSLAGQGDGQARPMATIMTSLQIAEANQKAFEEHHHRLQHLKSESAETNEKLRQLYQRRDALAKELEEVNGRIAKGETVQSEVDHDLQIAESEAGDFQNKSQEIEALRKELVTSEESGKAAVKREVATTRLAELKEKLSDCTNEHADLDKSLEALRQLRKNLLEGVNLGVTGLEVGSGQLLLHGVSFKQASLAQRIRVACSVAMLQNPRLRLLRIDNGEHLDRESRNYLLSLARERDWQVVMTCVSDQDELGVEIVDGEMEKPKAQSSVKPNGKLFDDKKTAVEASY